MTSLTILFALVVDRLLGEPGKWHPLVGFGWLAEKLETQLNQYRKLGPRFQRISGLTALVVLLTPFVVIAVLLTTNDAMELIFAIIILYLAIGQKSLIEHAKQVKQALDADMLTIARNKTACLVSRDTQTMNKDEMARATIESVLENGNDAIFASLFWYVVAGIPGVLLHRLVNTLDAMWGYRTDKYQHFGWAAARLDDLLSLIPARLTAFSYAVCGDFRQAIRSWVQQARYWESPNAGPVMAAGAGALSIQLGGDACYHGRLRSRPMLGTGKVAQSEDIDRALQLLYRSVALWLVVIAGVNYLV